MASLRQWIPTLLAIAVAAGCGGVGEDGLSGPGGRPTAETKKRVGTLLGASSTAMAQSGVQTAGQASAMDGGNGAGASGGMGWIGAFARNMASGFATVGLPKPGSRKVRENDDPVSGGGGFYFDEWLDLWVFASYTSTESTFDFYEDEAMSKKAGFMKASHPGEYGVFPMEWSSEYSLTAGTMAGSHGGYRGSMTSESSGRMDYDALWGGSRSEGNSLWTAEGSEWTNRSNLADGTWTKDNGTFLADGSGTSESSNSLGYRTEYRWFAGGGGTATIEGPDPGLPARIVWNAAGEGTITYADGTVEPFQWWTVGVATSGGGSDGTGGGSSGGSGGGDGSEPPPRKR